MANLIVSLKNKIYNPQFDEYLGGWTLNEYVSYSNCDGKTCLCFGSTSNCSAMSIQDNSYVGNPEVGHIYYGRCSWKTDAGYSNFDNRYEWFYTDTDIGHMVFACKGNTDNTWVTQSSLGILQELESGDYYIRNFTVNGSSNMYVTDMILIDLSESFGLGNEPSQHWCDINIPFFNDTTYLSYTDVKVKYEGNWKQATKIFIKENGNWNELYQPVHNGVSNIYKKVNGVWVNTI